MGFYLDMIDVGEGDAFLLSIEGHQGDLLVLVDAGPPSQGQTVADYIKRNANGTAKRCPPHLNEGPYALPHFQPDPRPPEGHTFYETSNRRASAS